MKRSTQVREVQCTLIWTFFLGSWADGAAPPRASAGVPRSATSFRDFVESTRCHKTVRRATFHRPPCGIKGGKVSTRGELKAEKCQLEAIFDNRVDTSWVLPAIHTASFAC